MTRILGVATCSRLDVADRFVPLFERLAPEIDLRAPRDIDRPEDVRFMLTFVPGDDAFTPYPNLEAAFSIGAGQDAIDTCPSRPEGLPVYRLEDPDQALQMAAFCVFHVQWHQREMFDIRAAQARGEWLRKAAGLSPRSKRIGVMGFGHMGRAVAKALVALGYPVQGYARRMPDPPEPGVTHFTDGQMDDFVARSDILVNVLPLTPQTRGLIDAGFLARLPQGAALIHVGRGGQVDEPALIAALDSGHLSGASVDVFETEPLPADHPFWAHERVFMTPHSACIPVPEAVVRSVRARMRSDPSKETFA
ncbi:hydroxyacid dehydrogenase [Salipiger aestuarii]|uniref:2-hydroxyacid dehydrogenase n=1 Tax=Salipiger aestuarii TaxID=568098 RepID=UPI00025B841E|nr:glyoxylate/hydroxypyruvate reductase A [Salipiger aestuarii]EIE50887.1 D-isomer specific 2-hydroxyacid dehydrogenase NAD-binding protein [Citreicella sp. 357]KAA8607888.1 hydroxyacid dehydrogenase [Salipiger aestuarii]KAA8611207.1 hydroxyacid dehydrogenase [Salipiger aestuarii]